MKVFFVTDMEGVAGVLNQDDYTTPDAMYYERGRELTTMEVNAAIEGALEAGATEFLVVDGHGAGAIDPQLLHPEAKLLAGSPLEFGSGLGCDESFDFAFSIGQHAKSNADGGHLSHTGSFDFEDTTINGVSLGELGRNMMFCNHFGVPTIFVSGDDACAREAKTLEPTIETVSVKWGLKRGSATGLPGPENQLFNGVAIHLSPKKARAAIRAGAKRAVERRHEIKPFTMQPPYEMVCTLRANGQTPARRGVVRHESSVLELMRLMQEMEFEEI